MNVNIDLGSDGSSPCCAPVCCDESKKYYPSFYYSGEEKLDLPKEGTMVIRFRKTRSEHSVNDKDEDHYSCNIEVREIVSVEGKDGEEVEVPSKNRNRESEDSLDRLHALLVGAKKKAKGEEGEY